MDELKNETFSNSLESPPFWVRMNQYFSSRNGMSNVFFSIPSTHPKELSRLVCARIDVLLSQIAGIVRFMFMCSKEIIEKQLTSMISKICWSWIVPCWYATSWKSNQNL